MLLQCQYVIEASLSPSLFIPYIKKEFHSSNKKQVSIDLEQTVKVTAEKCWGIKKEKEQTSEYFN